MVVLLGSGAKALSFVVHVVTRQLYGEVIWLGSWEWSVPWVVPAESAAVVVWSRWYSSFIPFLLSMNSCDLRCRDLVHLLYVLSVEICPRVGFDLRYSTPLIHSKLANSDFNIQSIIVLSIHVPVS